MRLKELKVSSKLLQHFVEKYVRMLEKEGFDLDIHLASKEWDEALIACYGVIDHVFIYDTKSEHLLMSVWHGRGGSMMRPDHLEAGYSINNSIDEYNKIENPIYLPTSYITKEEVDKWIKRVVRRQVKAYKVKEE